MRGRFILASIALSLGACGGEKTHGFISQPDSGVSLPEDAGPIDAGFDAGISIDAGSDAGVIVDAGSVEDAGTVVDAGTDAGVVTPTDAGPVDAGSVMDAGCSAPPPASSSCDPGNPSTCPNGYCIAGLCLGANVDPNEWNDCGDGICEQCETAQSCPADCAPPPTITGTKAYDDGTTMTVWLHGFENVGSAETTMVYGALSGCGDIGTAFETFGVDAPCGDTPAGATAPNQVVSVEYYGEVPPSWMSPSDIAEIAQYPDQGSTSGLERYALIVGKFIRYQMSVTGATHVNLSCHSMGCLISRYLIENDVEQLASRSVIVRWVTGSGVIAGAKLAELYNNMTVQKYATAIGLQLSDFVIMNPPFVQEYAAAWDHKLYEGNNPLMKGILIHHIGATDPQVSQAANIQLLDLLFPPGIQPNDGIMFTQDEYFASQASSGVTVTPSGQAVPATHSFVYAEHDSVPSTVGFQAMAAAALTGQRKVILSLQSVNLLIDREFDLTNELGEQGLPPAEVVMESTVLYDPYTMPTFNISTPVQQDLITYRSPSMYQQYEATTATPDEIFFAGPVFDQQNAIHLTLQLTEADLYPRFNVNEALLDTPNRALANFDADVPLQNQTIPLSTKYVSAVIQVQVVDMY